MIQIITKPFRWFFKLEAASGLVLLFAAIIALIVSNSNLSELYFSTLNKYLFLGVNNFGLKLFIPKNKYLFNVEKYTSDILE